MNEPSAADRWLHRLQTARYGNTLLAILSFAETIALPMPFEMMLVPYMLARRRQLWWVATVALLGCLAAAILGYWLAAGVFGQLEGWLGDLIGTARLEEGITRLREDGFVFLLLVALTPLPFQLGYLGAGAAAYPFGWFLLAIVLGRGLRYYGLAAATALFGERLIDVLRRHQWGGWVTAAVCATLWIVFAAVSAGFQ